MPRLTSDEFYNLDVHVILYRVIPSFRKSMFNKEDSFLICECWIEMNIKNKWFKRETNDTFWFTNPDDYNKFMDWLETKPLDTSGEIRQGVA